MTSRAREHLFEHANNHDILLHHLAPSGRNWHGLMLDARQPDRPERKFDGAFLRCKEEISRYANTRPATPPTQQAPMDETPAAEKVVERLVEDPESYDAGFNDGLSAGRAMGSRAATGDTLPANGQFQRYLDEIKDLQASLEEVTNDRDDWREAADKWNESNLRHLVAIQKRDAAIVVLQEELAKQPAATGAILAVRLLETQDLLTHLKRSLDTYERAASDPQRHTDYPNLLDQQTNAWRDHAARVLAAVNLVVENGQVKETP